MTRDQRTQARRCPAAPARCLATRAVQSSSVRQERRAARLQACAQQPAAQRRGPAGGGGHWCAAGLHPRLMSMVMAASSHPHTGSDGRLTEERHNPIDPHCSTVIADRKTHPSLKLTDRGPRDDRGPACQPSSSGAASNRGEHQKRQGHALPSAFAPDPDRFTCSTCLVSVARPPQNPGAAGSQQQKRAVQRQRPGACSVIPLLLQSPLAPDQVDPLPETAIRNCDDSPPTGTPVQPRHRSPKMLSPSLAKLPATPLARLPTALRRPAARQTARLARAARVQAAWGQLNDIVPEDDNSKWTSLFSAPYIPPTNNPASVYDAR